MNLLDKIKEIQKVQLKEGDILICHVPEGTTNRDVDEMKECLEKILIDLYGKDCGIGFIFIGNDVSIDVVNGESITENRKKDVTMI